MQPRGIAVEHAPAIAKLAQDGSVVVPRALALLGTQLQCHHRLDQRGTVQLARVDDEPFVLFHRLRGIDIDLEGMSHIGHSQKVARQREHARLRGGRLVEALAGASFNSRQMVRLS